MSNMKSYEDGVHAKLAGRIVAAIEADASEHQPFDAWHDGYRMATDRCIEIVRATAAVPVADLPRAAAPVSSTEGNPDA